MKQMIAQNAYNMTTTGTTALQPLQLQLEERQQFAKYIEEYKFIHFQC